MVQYLLRVKGACTVLDRYREYRETFSAPVFAEHRISHTDEKQTFHIHYELELLLVLSDGIRCRVGDGVYYPAKNTLLLEIQWILSPADRKEIGGGAAAFPVTTRYRDALQYRDPFKSEKTISRAIVPHRVLPRFAMGSVETYGDDLIGKHEHPLLDQFFFSFPENDMDLLLDDLVYPLKGNTLVHIPLGCDHGVSVKANQCAHYLWIDFIPGEEGLVYLDAVHKETGLTRSFDEANGR